MINRRWLAGLLSGAVMALTALPALAQEVTLKLHQFLPAQANVPKLILDVWADKVEADSDGRIRIARYPSMQLGGTPPQLMDQVADGVADIVWTVAGYTPGRFPSTEVFELPFMISDARAASSAYWQMYESRMQDEFADVKVLGTWVHGPGVIHASKQIRTPAKGVIDGTTIPWEVTGALKVPELVNYHTEFEGRMLYDVTFVLAMNKARYQSLPDDLKKVIDDNSGLEFSIFAGGTQADSDGPARQAAVDNGNQIVTLSEAEAQAWVLASQPVYDAWIAEMEAKGIDGQALIDEARRLMDEYEG